MNRFGGSKNFTIACLNIGRNTNVIEKDETIFEKTKADVMTILGDDDERKTVIEYDEFEEEMELEM